MGRLSTTECTYVPTSGNVSIFWNLKAQNTMSGKREGLAGACTRETGGGP